MKSKLMCKNMTLLILLCVILLPMTVFAAETGSIRVVMEEGTDITVTLYPVANTDGTMNEAFMDAGISPESILDEGQAEKNAKLLHQFALDEQIPGVVKNLGKERDLLFDELELGCYLIYCSASDVTFDPFLIYIPTKINGELIYNVKAEPKSEEMEFTRPAETEPTAPAPNIPQTGASVVPKYVFLALGSIITLIGLSDLVFGRKEDI